MRILVIAGLILGLGLVGLLLFWQPSPARSTPPSRDYQPALPAFVARLFPGPRAEVQGAAPTRLNDGQSWSGHVTARDKSFGVLKVRLTGGAGLRVSDGAEQTVCILSGATEPASDCGQEIRRDGVASLVVREGGITVTVRAIGGPATLLLE